MRDSALVVSLAAYQMQKEKRVSVTCIHVEALGAPEPNAGGNIDQTFGRPAKRRDVDLASRRWQPRNRDTERGMQIAQDERSTALGHPSELAETRRDIGHVAQSSRAENDRRRRVRQAGCSDIRVHELVARDRHSEMRRPDS
jgi:hypothetical protein